MNQIQSQTAIVLVQPSGERNVGSVARCMRNFGLQDLRLVAPQCNHLSLESRRMAMRSEVVLEAASVYDTLEDALADRRYVVATTARQRYANRRLQEPTPVLSHAVELAEPLALVFGPEEAGLSNQHLEKADAWMTFPTWEEARSLNLAMSVGIAAYELNRVSSPSGEQNHTPATSTLPRSERPATSHDVESLIQLAEDFFWQINFIQRNTRKARMRRLAHILRRAEISESDNRFLRAAFYFIQNKLNK